jgi:hypothetical protein
MMTEKMLQVFRDYRDDYYMFLECALFGRTATLPTNQALGCSIGFQQMWAEAYLEDMEG